MATTLVMANDYHKVTVDNNPPGYSSYFTGYYRGKYNSAYASKNLLNSYFYSEKYDGLKKE